MIQYIYTHFMACSNHNVCYLVIFICETSAFRFFKVEYRLMMMQRKRIMLNCTVRETKVINL